MNKFSISRPQLAAFIKDHDSVRAFERLFAAAGSTPATVEEALAQATSATALAHQALDMLSAVGDLLARLDTAPAGADFEPPNDTTPSIGTGSMGMQDQAAVDIEGGAIDGVIIGADAPDIGTFTTLSATGAFGCNGAAPQPAVVLGPAATDLPSALTLLNSIRSALIANGIGS